MKKILITGAAGFIGSNLVRYINKNTLDIVYSIDNLTYAGNLASLENLEYPERHHFHQIDICDFDNLRKVIFEIQPDKIMHLAAESHVDRSIDGPSAFIQTNIVGTYNLLQVGLEYFGSLNAERRASFKFHHISTDEVYGDLDDTDSLFTESTPYSPSSPYSASKASSDHLVRAWHRTYDFPAVITNCSNNYGPFHFPEKLIPLVILNALEGKSLPVYGDGLQIRDWLYVEDHVRALYLVVNRGVPGETYNIGGHNEVTNIAVVREICYILDELIEDKPHNIKSFKDLITFVKDRPGHDRRYAINASKILNDLGWEPQETFDSGLFKTVQWFVNNLDWCKKVSSAADRKRIGGKND